MNNLNEAWTMNLPTHDGVYWNSDGRGQRLEILEVFDLGNDPRVCQIGFEGSTPLAEWEGSLWLGPLPRPLLGRNPWQQGSAPAGG